MGVLAWAAQRVPGPGGQPVTVTWDKGSEDTNTKGKMSSSCPSGVPLLPVSPSSCLSQAKQGQSSPAQLSLSAKTALCPVPFLLLPGVPQTTARWELGAVRCPRDWLAVPPHSWGAGMAPAGGLEALGGPWAGLGDSSWMLSAHCHKGLSLSPGRR